MVSEKISRDEKTGVSKEVGFARQVSCIRWLWDMHTDLCFAIDSKLAILPKKCLTNIITRPDRLE